MTSTKPSGRLLSLDILRGVTIAGMLLVNNPGSWSSIYTPLEHAPWNGLTPTDLIFPFFMFIMGISTYFSLRKFDFKPSKHLFLKIFRRTVVIFAIGLAIHWFSHFCYYLGGDADPNMTFLDRLAAASNNFSEMRIMGVMQRLAISYCVGAVLAITVRFKWLPWIAGALVVIYAFVITLGHGYDLSNDNIIYIIDNAILGSNHMYHGLEVMANLPDNAFDPEGLFSTIPSIAHVLIGIMCGRMIMRTKDNYERISDLFIVGAILTFAGFLLSYGLPINKNIWSPTFVITTCGLASTFLGLLIWIIDIKGYKKWCRFFESFGINPLFLYVLGGVLSILMGSIKFTVGTEVISIKGIIYKNFLLAMMPNNPELASCLFAILFVCLNWCIGYVLYKKKIYIKI